MQKIIKTRRYLLLIILCACSCVHKESIEDSLYEKLIILDKQNDEKQVYSIESTLENDFLTIEKNDQQKQNLIIEKQLFFTFKASSFFAKRKDFQRAKLYMDAAYVYYMLLGCQRLSVENEANEKIPFYNIDSLFVINNISFIAESYDKVIKKSITDRTSYLKLKFNKNTKDKFHLDNSFDNLNLNLDDAIDTLYVIRSKFRGKELPYSADDLKILLQVYLKEAFFYKKHNDHKLELKAIQRAYLAYVLIVITERNEENRTFLNTEKAAQLTQQIRFKQKYFSQLCITKLYKSNMIDLLLAPVD